MVWVGKSFEIKPQKTKKKSQKSCRAKQASNIPQILIASRTGKILCTGVREECHLVGEEKKKEIYSATMVPFPCFLYNQMD